MQYYIQLNNFLYNNCKGAADALYISGYTVFKCNNKCPVLYIHNNSHNLKLHKLNICRVIIQDSKYDDVEGEILQPQQGFIHNNKFDETGGDKIHPGLQITKGQLLSLTLAYYLRHNHTKKALHDMLCLLNAVVPGCVPASKYFIDRYFFNDINLTLPG